MFSRSKIKEKAKKAIYQNYKNCIIICFIYTVLIGSNFINIYKYSDFDYKNVTNINITNLHGDNNSEIVNDFLNGITSNNIKNDVILNSASKGIIGEFFNNVTKSGSFLFGFLNGINQALFNDHIWASIVILIGTLIIFLYWVFVSKVLEVGYDRFYLENRKYTKTKANRLILPYRINKVTNIAYIMFLKNLYTILWLPTVIGPFIKHYEYFLVPYILAENPNIKAKEAISLSKKMMAGYKWEVFKLDLSFIGYHLLGLLTFNLSNIIFKNPYMHATYAEIYMEIRSNSKKKKIKGTKYLNDKYLEGDIEISEYPIYNTLLAKKHHKLLDFNYKRDYTIIDYILLFFIFSLIGYIHEVSLSLIQNGVFVNRGALYGPWLPIYGSGCIAILIILKKYRDNPFLYFILAMMLCGTIEYFTSIYLELVHGLQWWNYYDYFLNLNGRICLEGLLFFAAGGTFITYLVAPVITNYLDKIKKDTKIIICVILLVLIGIDFQISKYKPNTGEGISGEIKEVYDKDVK